MQSTRVFLSAEWRDLVILNYQVEPALLSRYVPPGTSLDSFQAKTYVSLVGFRFLNTKLLGHFRVPFHSNFDEVNLRSYVRRQRRPGGEDRRGVVFINEAVPRRAIAATARLLYGENYRYARMGNRIETHGANRKLEYRWQVEDHWCRLSAKTEGDALYPEDGTLQQFITEHYWGYSTQSGGRCVEYQVSHMPWRVWSVSAASFEGDASTLYGPELAKVLQRRPDSAFVAEGSPVKVFKGSRIL